MDLGFKHTCLAGTAGRVVLALHGTGGDEHDLVPLAQTLAPGAAILSPRGRVNESGSNRFFRRLSEGVFDLDDLKLQTDALADFVGLAAREYGFGLENVTAVGFSNGANIAAALMLLRPEVLHEAILIRAMVPLEPELGANLHSKRVLILSGEHDPLVPHDDVDHLAEMLRARGADVTHNYLPTGHQLTRQDIGIATEWLA